ncbi:MAG: hypothetical protein AXW12_00525 [Thalassospira sp. Nap_22]|nr:MAG: hypothetical protein AXW12_00525 [Thalassospira sp. Nap_22]
MITQEELKAILSYDQETGAFTWLSAHGPMPKGMTAGTLNKTGYIHIQINGRRYGAHRLAWLWMTGEWPKRQIDHRNNIRNDNRWTNLRKATKSQNCANSLTYKTNTTGFRGVSWHQRDQVYIAAIGGRVNRRHIGTFRSKEDAARAYDEVAKDIFGDFATLNFPDQTDHSKGLIAP